MRIGVRMVATQSASEPPSITGLQSCMPQHAHTFTQMHTHMCIHLRIEDTLKNKRQNLFQKEEKGNRATACRQKFYNKKRALPFNEAINYFITFLTSFRDSCKCFIRLEKERHSGETFMPPHT